MLPLMDRKVGSIVVMMLMALTILTVFMYSLLSTVTHTLLLARARHEYEKHYQIIKSTHEYAITKYHKNKNTLFTLQTTIPSQENILHVATTYVKKTKKQTILQTDLRKQGKVVATISTSV